MCVGVVCISNGWREVTLGHPDKPAWVTDQQETKLLLYVSSFYFGDNLLFTFLMIVCKKQHEGGKKRKDDAYNNLILRFVDFDEFIYWLIIYAMLGQCLFFYWIDLIPPPVWWSACYWLNGGHGNSSRHQWDVSKPYPTSILCICFWSHVSWTTS